MASRGSKIRIHNRKKKTNVLKQFKTETKKKAEPK